MAPTLASQVIGQRMHYIVGRVGLFLCGFIFEFEVFFKWYAKATRRKGSRAWPGHLQGGDRLQPRPPYKGAVSCGQAPCKGRSPAGQQPLAGMTDCGRGASRKAACGQKHRPLPTASPMPAVSPQGVACLRQGRSGSAFPRPARRGAAPTEAPPAGTAPAVGAVAGRQRQPPPA
ncbi:hypothetical protein GW17_00039820 [Ensete ventricosum]|nr:hypothetical protein GW17_00039820 [Ensete ventricosum]